MRLITWNIEHGRANARHRAGAGRARAHVLQTALNRIADYEPDVVTFQEVDRFQPRSYFTDQAQLIADTFRSRGFTWSHYVPSIVRLGLVRAPGLAVPGASWLPSFGNMMVSRSRPRQWKIADLGRAKLRWRTNGIPLPVPGENRTLLAARFGESAVSSPITVASTHLELQSAVARSQLNAAWKLTRSVGLPAVLLGDYNLSLQGTKVAVGAVTAEEPKRATSDLAVSQPTFPSVNPAYALDQALCSAGPGCSLDVVAVSTIELDVSDHNALVVDIEVDDDSHTD
ncbi:MAG: endonuclease/exonuclease/phosphatase family protein [Actinomycetaceae bacterium]|nr:endonuclease/exonuclease/phosphatase family protein [Actinomycetaceae bacterium]